MARLAVFINVISLTPRPLKQTQPGMFQSVLLVGENQSTEETFESVRLKSKVNKSKVCPFAYNRKFKRVDHHVSLQAG